MAKDMSAVGNTASASKDKTGLKGNEVLTGVRFEKSENGGFILHQTYRLDVPKDNKRDGCFPTYCPDKTFTFDSYDEMKTHMDGVLGTMKPM